MVRCLLLVALVACGEAKLEFRRFEYPGFSLETPTSLVPAPDAAYGYGEARVNLEAAAYSVSWHANPLPEDPALIAGFTQGLREMLHDPDISRPRRGRVAGHDALRFDQIRKGDFWTLVAVSCGARTVQIMVHARDHGDVILSRMLDSFDCHPVAAEDQRLAAAVPFGLDDRSRIAGWKRVRDPGAFTIADDAHAASFKRSPGDWHKGIELMAVLPQWKVGPSTTAPDGSRIWADITTPDGSTGALESWPCGTDRMLALAVGYDPPAAREFLSAFRCARPGDAPFPQFAEPVAPPGAPPASAPRP